MFSEFESQLTTPLLETLGKLRISHMGTGIGLTLERGLQEKLVNIVKILEHCLEMERAHKFKYTF